MFSIYHRTKALVGAVAVLVSITVLSTADAGHIPAGNDYFETVATGTSIDFSHNPIPPGFFNPGSDPFTGTVPLQGMPLNPATLGTTDTIVQRLSDIHITQHGGQVTVPIEIVALHLVSVQPITVTYNGGHNPEQWNVTLTLPNQQQQQGSMTIVQTGPHGGTFDSTLPVQPILIFTRVSDNQMRTIDPGPININGNNIPWAYKADRSYNLLTSPKFCASCDGTGAPVSSSYTSDFMVQVFTPATRQ